MDSLLRIRDILNSVKPVKAKVVSFDTDVVISLIKCIKVTDRFCIYLERALLLRQSDCSSSDYIRFIDNIAGRLLLRF